ncbi:NAD(P)H-dependent oxidoreductase [Pedobacter sp. AW31-3R]|uniref:NAD(P)H-dependent oxidoreductase n=1 Tax=Pedobacter sp. AW31-3R TaxID=3445781 RepID=UPI003F9F6E5F
MIIVDTALSKLEEKNTPIKVALVGAGFMGRAIALQICKFTPGMKLVAISNHHPDKARQAYLEAGITETSEVSFTSQLESNIRDDRYSITSNAMLLCEAEGIDAIIEVTGAIEFSAHVAMCAIENGKHVILMNAELDGTIGPILKYHADKAGVVITNADGDQPGVTMNLYRFVKSIGLKPVLCGNMKGLHDPYRNPSTQESFAKKWGQKAAMVASFADGSKISFEQAIIANGTGMRVSKRGMAGPTVEISGTALKDAIQLFDAEELLKEGPGIVDYIVGAEPGPGVFVLGTTSHPLQQHYLNLYKLGEGPFYLFYTPYHLCHLEVPTTVARAVLFKDAALTPLGRPYVEVVAAAKTDLKAGTAIDGIGHYMTYGLCENADIVQLENLLPLGIAENCILKHDIPKDQILTYDDVILPEGRLVDQLRIEQVEHFKMKTSELIQP